MTFGTILVYVVSYFGLFTGVFFLWTLFENRDKIRNPKARDFPVVSVIVPVYNAGDTLVGTIKSLLNLDYPRDKLEIIIVDDGSTDSTREIIHSYGSRIIPIWKENGGVASALNVGIQQARGEYIAWLSHDDMFLPYKIERQVEFFIRNPSYNFCYGNYIVVDEKGTKLYEVKSSQLSGYKARQQLLISSYIHGCTTLIHRNCFEKVGIELRPEIDRYFSKFK